MTSPDSAWGGSSTPPAPWQSGRWRLELRDDEIADIRFDGRPVLRSIRGVARDRDWGTIPPVVTSVVVERDRLVVLVSLVGRDADLAARLVVEARGDDLDISWRCEVRSPFLRNRLGLVVLHPPALAGSALAITHPDGGVDASSYPLDISPHQPAFEIAALAWTHDGLATRLDFSGDVFEMEDQRNWTDASYKTYSTPLAVPFPVRVEAGETVLQSIRIACSADSPADAAGAADRIDLVEAHRPVPAVSTSASTGSLPSAPSPVGSTLLVELPAHTEVWRDALDRAVVEAGGLPLDVRIVGPSPERLEEVLDAVAPLSLARIGVFSADTHVSEPGLWRLLVDGLAARALATPTVGGTRAHFTELNRELHRLPPGIPAHTFSVTPQMHATGREQLIESIAMQRLVAENAVRMTRTGVHVGPITLRARFNAVATTRTPDADVVDLARGYNAAVTADATDPRQSSPALLAWTVASAAALAIEGVSSVTWFEASGPRGLRDADGHAFPVATALDWLADIAGAPLLWASRAPEGLWALGARKGDTSIVLVASLRAKPATVTIATSDGEQRIELPAYGARRLEFGL